MSSLSTFSSKSQVRPPDKGSFPLDHEDEPFSCNFTSSCNFTTVDSHTIKRECKEFMIKYMQCLRINKRDASKCREACKDYLNCRMDKNLMKKEDWSKLGLADVEQDKG